MRLKNGILVFAVSAIVLVAPAARADDYAQLEKAKDILNETEQHIVYFAWDKANEGLAAAEKEIASVDETGKADTVTRIKEDRQKIADGQKRLTSADFKSNVERTIASGEEASMRNGGGDSLNFQRADAALKDSYNRAHIDAPVIADLEKKLAWSRKKTAQAGTAEEKRSTEGSLSRMFDELDRTVEGAATTTDEEGYTRRSFKEHAAEIEKTIAEHQAALGDSAAEYTKRLATARETLAKNLGDAQIKDLQDTVNKIQEVLDGKNNNVYRDNVEGWFKAANARAPKCPQDSRTKTLTTKLAEQRKTWDGQVAQADRDAVVKPAIEYWKTCQENYGKEGQGWEQETKPTALADYLHHSPSTLGCDKTEKFLSEVIQRWYGGSTVEDAFKKYPNDPEFKKVADEVSALREKASTKIIAFTNSILDEAEKLPEGRERKDMATDFYNMRNNVERHAKGSSGVAKIVERIEALKKKWEGDQAANEAAKEAKWKECCDATEAAWPGLASGWLGKVKKLDANAALKDIGSWKGTVVHFDGGAHGVNMNRAGWDWMDDYTFVVSVDGVPVCGDVDGGVRDAIAKVCEKTGIAEDDLQECIGIVEGTCKATQRVKIFDQYVSGNTLEGVKIRIIAWKACTVCAVAGEGTNLSKLKGESDISVNASGVSASGGHWFGRMVHRLIAWAMCLVLFVSGALCAAHGASRFVPQIQENLAKLGNGLGYAGIGIAVVGALWFVAAIAFWVIWGSGGSLPSIALFFAGAFVGLDFLRVRGTLKPELASTIQPLGIVLGLGCFAAALIHFLLWDVTLL